MVLKNNYDVEQNIRKNMYQTTSEKE